MPDIKNNYKAKFIATLTMGLLLITIAIVLIIRPTTFTDFYNFLNKINYY